MADEWIAKGDLVGLRPVADDDAELLYRCWHDADTQKDLNMNEPELPLAEWWREEQQRPDNWLRCIIVELATGQPAGLITLGSKSAEPELTIILLSEFRGRGLAVEACGLVIDYGFRVMGLTSIGGGALDSNPASQRMLAQLGFVRMPDEDKSYPNKWGVGRVTEHAYRLDRSDWEPKAA